jgi:hypothetical protein
MTNKVSRLWLPLYLMTAIIVLLMGGRSAAQVADWPDVFDPLALHRLYLEMDPDDWLVIQNDQTFELEMPALFWADGEDPLLVAVRRKSASALTEDPRFIKVSLKIDINEYVVGQTWHGLHKLSLENGDDQDVVAEGLAWYCHRLASGPLGYGYEAGLSNWVTMNINGIDTGVYVSQEQRDKQWLRNRNLFVANQTWLYKKSDQGPATLEVGPDDGSNSPTHVALCYSPFRSPGDCPTPNQTELAAELPTYINMQAMLTLGAVNAFIANPDEMFNHQKNFWFADFTTGPTRMYLPWDLDSSMPGGGLNRTIYGNTTPYETILLGNPTFRAQYSQIMNNLICGPLAAENLIAFVNSIEPILTPALETDLNNRIGDSIGDHFDSIRGWIAQRVPIVAGQIEGFQPCGVVPCEACDADCNGKVDELDILRLVELLLGAGSPCASCAGDTNDDQSLDGRDIQVFVNCLVGPS